jgi:hypothetical protein
MTPPAADRISATRHVCQMLRAGDGVRGRSRRLPVREAQQTKYLTPPQADQFTRVGDAKTPRSNPQQNLKPAELLLAHRHHRHGAPSGTQNPGECHVYFAQGCHLYIALTVGMPRLSVYARHRHQVAGGGAVEHFEKLAPVDPGRGSPLSGE